MRTPTPGAVEQDDNRGQQPGRRRLPVVQHQAGITAVAGSGEPEGSEEGPKVIEAPMRASNGQHSHPR